MGFEPVTSRTRYRLIIQAFSAIFNIFFSDSPNFLKYFRPFPQIFRQILDEKKNLI